MKRLNTSAVTSDVGLVFQHKHVTFLQDKTEESLIHSIYSQIGAENISVVILYGCIPTFTTTTTSNDTLTITAGAISYQGKIYEVGAATMVKTGASVHTLKLLGVTNDPSDPSLFTDGIPRPVQDIRVAALSIQASGAGISDWANVLFLQSIPRAVIDYLTSKKTYSAVLDIGAWNMNTALFITIPYPSIMARANIRRCNAIILADDGSFTADLGMTITSADTPGNVQLVSSGIVLNRGAGVYNNTNHSSISINRGFLYIEIQL